MQKEWPNCSKIVYSHLWGSQRRSSWTGTHTSPLPSSEHCANNWRFCKTSVLPITHRQMGNISKNQLFLFHLIPSYYILFLLFWGCKASSGWVIQGGSRSQKGKRGRKRGGGER